MKVKLNHETAAALRDAANRHGLTMGEIARRACRKFERIGRVADLPKRKPATRKGATCYTLRNLPDDLDYLVPRILDWYLANYDNGQAAPEPAIDPADLCELRKVPTLMPPTYHLREPIAQ